MDGRNLAACTIITISVNMTIMTSMITMAFMTIVTITCHHCYHYYYYCYYYEVCRWCKISSIHSTLSRGCRKLPIDQIELQLRIDLLFGDVPALTCRGFVAIMSFAFQGSDFCRRRCDAAFSSVSVSFSCVCLVKASQLLVCDKTKASCEPVFASGTCL